MRLFSQQLVYLHLLDIYKVSGFMCSSGNYCFCATQISSVTLQKQGVSVGVLCGTTITPITIQTHAKLVRWLLQTKEAVVFGKCNLLP